MARMKGFLRKQLANELKRRRGEMSQLQFARLLGVDGSSLNRIENQIQNVSIDTLEKFCRNLNCEVSDLFKPPD
jgi:transcriptional regulator with XRE-family HTH domain